MIKFMDLNVGQKFKTSVNGGPVTEYIKIPEERISCCHILTAAEVSNSAQKVQITPLTEVELVVENNS
jgi:hypothetical protein